LRAWLTTACCLSLLVVPVGCDPGPIYTDRDRRVDIGCVPDRGMWDAYGSVENPARAIDGNINTAATGVNRDRAASLVVDLGKPGTFNMVVIDHGRNAFGFAREVEVWTSLDGKSFKPRYRAMGTRRVSTFWLRRPVLARYVRLDAVLAGNEPWSLAEIHLQ